MTRERDRYPRASRTEQLGDLVSWFVKHPIALVLLGIVVLGIIVQIVAPAAPAGPNDLAIGDCLYVPTPQANDIGAAARPIGRPDEVASVLLRGGAEQASCEASHGHEVSAVFEYPRAQDPRGLPIVVESACRDAFGGYVGRPLEVSSYETFPVVPDVEQWDAGINRAICLVARIDGQWMTAPARDSRE